MPTDDLNNIEAKLNFSKRLGGLVKGHQQEMQQVQLLLMPRGRRENVSKFAYVYIFLYLCSAK